ncbi:MAG: hypothetical protein ACI9UA_001520 [Pseudoalteromonas tetraodonis]|jgi:hypothetical protein
MGWSWTADPIANALSTPQVCAAATVPAAVHRLWEQTSKRLEIVPSSSNDSGVMALGCLLTIIPFASFVLDLVTSLSKKKVRVPMCHACRSNLIKPPAKTTWLFVVLAFLIGSAIFGVFTENWSLASWSTVVILLTTVILIVILQSGEHERLPIQIERVVKNFRYRIYESSPYFLAWADTPNGKVVDDH